MALKTHYDALAVARSADGDVIRAAYRVLAKRYHPDTATGPKEIAAAHFRRIQEAYEVLSDARRRAKYDAQLDALTTEPQARQRRRAQRESHRAQPRPNRKVIGQHPNENLHREADPARMRG
jgi:curved DNA-binding protein CbpA